MQFEPTSSSLDEYLDALGDVERRRLLFGLLESEATEPVAVGRFVNESDRQDLEIVLRHVHLPKLRSAGLIEWEDDQNRVYRGPDFDDIIPILECLAEHKTH